MRRIFIRLVFVVIIFSMIGYSGAAEKFRNAYSERTKYVGINVKDIHEETVNNNLGEGNQKRATVTYNPDKITDESLSNFYKDKVNGTGYMYYTFINEKDKTQGIVSVACINVLTYGKINDMGAIVKADKNFEVKMDVKEVED